MSDHNDNSLFKRLKERKVIPYFVTYLGGAFASVQFVDWFCARNMYSPIWTDLLLALLILLIPTVLIVLYVFNHQHNFNFNKRQSIVIGINIMAILAFSTLKFRNQSFAATGQKVTIVNEEGEKEKRLVPSAQFAKSVSIFPLVTSSMDEKDQSFYAFTLPYLLSLELEQNPRVYATSPSTYKLSLKEYNYQVGGDIPFSAKLKKAKDNYQDYLVTGEVTTLGDSIIANFTTHTVADGVEFWQHRFSGTDIYEIADQFSNYFFEHLYTKDYKMDAEKFLDIPAKDLISNDLSALRSFGEGYYATTFADQYAYGIKEFENSIQKDPNCAECFILLASNYMGNNQGEEAIPHLEKAIKLSSVLPERQKFRIRYVYYLFKNELTQAISLLEMWRTLYPYNVEPYKGLIQFLSLQGEYDRAIQVGEDAVNQGLKGNYLLQLSELAAEQNKFEKAISYFEKYKEEYPEKALESKTIGNIYQKMGDFEAALKHYQQVAILRPESISNQIEIAKTEGKLGNFDKEHSLLEAAYAKATNAQDSVKVLVELENYFQNRGQLHKCIDIMENRWKLSGKYLPPIATLVEILQLPIYNRYFSVGRAEEADLRVDQLKGIFNDPIMSSAILLNGALVKKDTAYLNKTWPKLRDWHTEKSGLNNTILIDAFMNLCIGKYGEAIQDFHTFIDSTGVGNQAIGDGLVEAYYQNGDYQKALEECEVKLTPDPYSALFLLYKYKILRKSDSGNPQEVADKLYQLWNNADPDYIRYQEFQKLSGTQ